MKYKYEKENIEKKTSKNNYRKYFFINSNIII